MTLTWTLPTWHDLLTCSWMKSRLEEDPSRARSSSFFTTLSQRISAAIASSATHK
jgi:hypothetical protein